MPGKPQLLSVCILLIALFTPSLAADANQTVQLVSRERAMSVLAGTNNSILFVDKQIALAELEKRDLVSAVANLASARGVFKGAASAFESGDYVKAVGLSSDASLQAQRALVAIPPTSPKPASSFTWSKASPVVKSANETIIFVDEKIAEAELARRDVIKPVELLAEARGLFRQASAAFAEGDYKSAYELASDATAKAQESLAVLSNAEKKRGILDAKSLAIACAAIALIAAVIYFGPLKNRPKPQAQLIQQYPQPVTSGQRPTYYPQYPQTMRAQYQPGQSYYNPQQQQPGPSPQPTQALRLTAQALRLTAQAQPYYYRQRVQPYYAAQPAAQPKPFARPIQPSPSQQQPFPPQQATRPPQPWQQQPQASRLYYYQQPQYQKPPQKKQQP